MVGLTAAQKDKLRIKLGDKTSAMASALVEMLVTSPDGSEWVHTGFSGAIVLCVERGKGTPVWGIKLLDPETFDSKLEQEINASTGYTKSTEYFHTFNSDNAIVGLEFQDEKDAEAFLAKINAVPVKHEGATSPTGEESKGPTSPAVSPSPFTSPGPGTKKTFLTGLGKYFKPKPAFGATTEALTISGPTNFVRVQHIGYDSATGAFDIDSIPEEWKAMFKKAGVKKKDLRDSHTASELMGTIRGFKALAAPAAPPAPPPPPPPPPPPAAPVPKAPKPAKEGEDEPSKSESKSTTTLLSEIQAGVQLKKAAPPDLKRMATEEKADLEGQLRAKMEALRGHIEVEDDDEDDWD